MSWGEGLDNGEVSNGTVIAALGNAHTCLCERTQVHTLLCADFCLWLQHTQHGSVS